MFATRYHDHASHNFAAVEPILWLCILRLDSRICLETTKSWQPVKIVVAERTG